VLFHDHPIRGILVLFLDDRGAIPRLILPLDDGGAVTRGFRNLRIRRLVPAPG
jgi:hypothetical protein